MNLKLPATDRLVCQDLGEGDGQTISEEPLTSLALHIKSCRAGRGSLLEDFGKLQLKMPLKVLT